MVSLRRGGRWLSLSTFVLVGLFFLLPFVTVSCVPGGYGQVGSDGATTYRGVDLVIGSEPVVTEDKLRAPEQRRTDRLPAQPLAIGVALLVAGGVAVVLAANDARVRRRGVAIFAGLAAVVLIANQAVVQNLLAQRITEQLTQPIPPDHEVSDYIQARQGFWLSLLALMALSLANAIGLRRLRRRASAVAPVDAHATTLPTPVDPWPPTV